MKGKLRGLFVLVLLFCVCICAAGCAKQPESALSAMYGDRYLYRDGRHLYVEDAGTPYEKEIDLAGMPEEKIDRESTYGLSFVRVFRGTEPDGEATLQFLEYEIVNRRDYAIDLQMQEYALERKIDGSWYKCVSEGDGRILEIRKLPPGEPVTRQIVLSRSVYTDPSKSTLRWEDLPAGHYRLLQKFDIRYIEMEFDIP